MSDKINRDSLFSTILLGQWHKVSEPRLEGPLIEDRRHGRSSGGDPSPDKTNGVDFATACLR